LTCTDGSSAPTGPRCSDLLPSTGPGDQVGAAAAPAKRSYPPELHGCHLEHPQGGARLRVMHDTGQLRTLRSRPGILSRGLRFRLRRQSGSRHRAMHSAASPSPGSRPGPIMGGRLIGLECHVQGNVPQPEMGQPPPLLAFVRDWQVELVEQVVPVHVEGGSNVLAVGDGARECAEVGEPGDRGSAPEAREEAPPRPPGRRARCRMGSPTRRSTQCMEVAATAESNDPVGLENSGSVADLRV
jgi:hypothetical protein